MGFKSLLTTSIENILNLFSYYSHVSRIGHQKLSDEILIVALREFPILLILISSGQHSDILYEWEDIFHCSVTTYISKLSRLLELQKLTILFFKEKLKIKGNFQIAKKLFIFDNTSKFELDNLVSPYVSDIAVECIDKVFHTGSAFLKKIIKRQQRYISDVITEEWLIAPGSAEVIWFSKEVLTTNHAVKLFASRFENWKTNDTQ